MAINLNKIDSTNIDEMVRVLNQNFALIQNSPLYKGIPGNKGDQGERGDRGQRGNIFVFTSRATLLKVFNKSTDTFMNPISGNKQITIDFIVNEILNKSDRSNRLAAHHYVSSFNDGDVFVIPATTEMCLFKSEGGVAKLIKTGMFFDAVESNISDIEAKYGNVIKELVDNYSENITNIPVATYNSYAALNVGDTSVGAYNKDTFFHFPLPDAAQNMGGLYNADPNDTVKTTPEEARTRFLGYNKVYTSYKNSANLDILNPITLVLGDMKRFSDIVKPTALHTGLNFYKLPALSIVQNNPFAGIMLLNDVSSNVNESGNIFLDSSGAINVRAGIDSPSKPLLVYPDGVNNTGSFLNQGDLISPNIEDYSVGLYLGGKRTDVNSTRPVNFNTNNINLLGASFMSVPTVESDDGNFGKLTYKVKRNYTSFNTYQNFNMDNDTIYENMMNLYLADMRMDNPTITGNFIPSLTDINFLLKILYDIRQSDNANDKILKKIGDIRKRNLNQLYYKYQWNRFNSRNVDDINSLKVTNMFMIGDVQPYELRRQNLGYNKPIFDTLANNLIKNNGYQSQTAIFMGGVVSHKQNDKNTDVTEKSDVYNSFIESDRKISFLYQDTNYEFNAKAPAGSIPVYVSKSSMCDNIIVNEEYKNLLLNTGSKSPQEICNYDVLEFFDQHFKDSQGRQFMKTDASVKTYNHEIGEVEKGLDFSIDSSDGALKMDDDLTGVTIKNKYTSNKVKNNLLSIITGHFVEYMFRKIQSLIEQINLRGMPEGAIINIVPCREQRIKLTALRNTLYYNLDGTQFDKDKGEIEPNIYKVPRGWVLAWGGVAKVAKGDKTFNIRVPETRNIILGGMDIPKNEYSKFVGDNIVEYTTISTVESSYNAIQKYQKENTTIYKYSFSPRKGGLKNDVIIDLQNPDKDNDDYNPHTNHYMYATYLTTDGVTKLKTFYKKDSKDDKDKNGKHLRNDNPTSGEYTRVKNTNDESIPEFRREYRKTDKKITKTEIYEDNNVLKKRDVQVDERSEGESDIALLRTITIYKLPYGCDLVSYEPRENARPYKQNGYPNIADKAISIFEGTFK